MSNHNGDGFIGLLAGMLGGMTKFILAYVSLTFFQGLVEAAITALICGACGIAGKELYVLVKKRIVKQKPPIK